MMFDNIKIPKKITPCPIAEAVIELRFDANQPPDTILGIVYNKIKEKFPKVESLPITQLPPLIREKDPQLAFSPHYRLVNKDFIFQIGPKCLSLACIKEYKGWNKYYDEINWIFKEIKKLNFIEKPLRLGLRYINFFEGEQIFEKVKINLSLAGNSLIQNKNFFRTEFDLEKLHCIVQITNDALLDENIKGSTIDIDILKEATEGNFFDSLDNIINLAHTLEKKVFFGILNEAYLQKFNPEY